MPRRSKNIRRPVPRKEVVFGAVRGSTKLRAVILEHFENKWACIFAAETLRRITVETQARVEDIWRILCDEFPGLAEGDLEALAEHFDHAERAARSAQRERELRERLATWPAAAWATIFIERPDFEAQLTPEQAAEWQEFRERVRRERERPRKLAVMPPPEVIR